jgi:hypothetical protein
MSRLRVQSKLYALVSALQMSAAALAQTRIPATGLCNTGLTPPASPAEGCKTSTPVTSDSGGPSVDGNWQLAAPYPSAPYYGRAPDPCKLTTFGPAWVDAPTSVWLNPDDGLSQWITPEAIGSATAGGWYIYRTALPIPPVECGQTKYTLTVAGHLLSDDQAMAVFLDNPASDRRKAYLYFLVYNNNESPTGLRLKSSSAYFVPE